MLTTNRFYRACIYSIASMLPMIAYGSGDGFNQEDANANCSAYLPSEATRVDSFQLCHSDHGGNNELYACQNFASPDGHYRVFFKGGRFPKAIAMIAENGEVNKMLWSEAKQVDRPVCNFPPPKQIPATTKFIGAGVCENNAGQSIPCTAFRNKAPRLKTITDHMVYYNKDGTGPEYTSTINISVNHDAVPAELAFQIGLNLIKTQCCQQRGLQYIKHAYQLYPSSALYRTAYQHFRQQTSSGVQLPLASSRLE